MEIVFLVGGRAYSVPEQSAIELRDRIREHVSDDRTLSYLADVITEDLEQGESPERVRSRSTSAIDRSKRSRTSSSAPARTNRATDFAKRVNGSQNPDEGRQASGRAGQGGTNAGVPAGREYARVRASF